jgi:hypothetical protein
MREAHDFVASKYSATYAHHLCVVHPLAVFLGKPFDVAEEPRGLYDDLPEPTWWQRLTSALGRR